MEPKSIGPKSEDSIAQLKKAEKKSSKQQSLGSSIALTFAKVKTFYAPSKYMVKEKI